MVKLLKLNSEQSVSESVSQSVTKVGIELLGQLKRCPCPPLLLWTLATIIALLKQLVDVFSQSKVEETFTH